MAVGGRRKLRLFFKFGLLVCLPVTGYLWAVTGVSTQSITMTALSVVMALGAEGLVSAAEARLSGLREQDATAENVFRAEAHTRDEKLRQMDRIVETLSNQNHDLRGKLVSIHGEVHRVQEETAHMQAEAQTEATEETKSTDEGGADVTDITSLRRR